MSDRSTTYMPVWWVGLKRDESSQVKIKAISAEKARMSYLSYRREAGLSEARYSETKVYTKTYPSDHNEQV